MKILKDTRIIILILLIIIVFIIIYSRTSLNLSPNQKLAPKCVYQGTIILPAVLCSHEDALIKRPCLSQNSAVVGICLYYPEK